MNNESVESMRSEPQSLKQSELADDLISNQIDPTFISMKNKEKDQHITDQDDSDKENNPKNKRNNIDRAISLETENSRTPKIFIANIKTKIGKKVSNILDNVPRSIIYSKTVDNFKVLLNNKPFWASSSSNNINKLLINDSHSMEQSTEVDKSIKKKVPNVHTENRYEFNDELIVKMLNKGNDAIPQYFVKPSINQITHSCSQSKLVGQIVDQTFHELNMINNLNASDLRNKGCWTNKITGWPEPTISSNCPVDPSSVVKDLSDNSNNKKCKNYIKCKGLGNTNPYTNCKTHRKVNFCPMESKLNKKRVKCRDNFLADVHTNKFLNGDQIDEALSTEYTEMQTKACQSEFSEPERSIKKSHIINVDLSLSTKKNENTDVVTIAPNDDSDNLNSQNNNDIIIDDDSNEIILDDDSNEIIIDEDSNEINTDELSNKFDQTRAAHINNAMNNSSFSSFAMSFPYLKNLDTEESSFSVKNANYKDALLEHDQISTKRDKGHLSESTKKCPNFSICKGNGNKDSKRSTHRVIAACPITYDQVDENNTNSSCSKNSSNTDSEGDSTLSNASFLSNLTDDSEIKEIYKKSGIPRTTSKHNFRKNVLKKNFKKNASENLKYNMATSNKMYEDLIKRHVDLQRQFDQSEEEITKLNCLLNQQKNKKNSCPTKGCSGAGNINNVNYEGHHTTLSSCPIDFIQKTNNDLISKQGIEILKLKTELNVDMPRYMEQINILKKTNSDLQLKIKLMSASIDQNKNQIQNASIEINKEIFDQNDEIAHLKKELAKATEDNDMLKDQLALKTDAYRESSKQMEDENMEIEKKLKELEKKYQAIISHNSNFVSNLEKKQKTFESDMNMKLDSEIFSQNLQKEELANLTSRNKIIEAELREAKQTSETFKSQLSESKKSAESLNSQLNETTVKINSVNDQLEESKNNVNDLKKQLRDSKAETETFNKQLTISNLLIESLKSQLNESKSKENVLNDELVNLNATVTSIQSQLDEKNTDLDSSQQTLSKEKLQMQIQITKLTSDLTTANKRSSDVEAEKTKAETTAETLKSQLTESKKYADSLFSQLNESTLKVKVLNDQFEESKSFVDDLKKQLRDSKAETEGLNNQLNESNLTIESLKSQLNESKSKESVLNDQLVNLNATVASIQSQLDEKNTNLDGSQQALSKEKLQMQIQITKLTSDLAIANKRSLDVEAEQKKAETTAETLKIQLSESKKSAESLNSQLNETTVKINSLNDQLEESKTIVNDLKKQLRDSKAETEGLNYQLNESNLTIESLKSQLNESMSKEKVLNDQLDNLNAMVNSIQTQLDEKNTNLDSSQQALSKEKLQMQIQITKLTSDLAIANKRSLDVEAEHKKAETTAETLKSELTETKKFADILNSQLKVSTENVKNLNDQLKKTDLNVDDLKRQLNESNTSSNLLVIELNEYKNNDKSLMNELNKLKGDVENLNAIKNDFENKLLNANQRCDQLYLEKNQTAFELENLKTENDNFRTLIKKRKESMDIQTSEVTKLNGIISKLKQDLSVKTTETDELNEKIVGLDDLNKKLDDDNRELTNKLIDRDVLQTEMNLNKSYTFDQLNEFQSQIDVLKFENEKLKNDLKKLSKTKCDLENQIFNRNASISLSSSLSPSSLTQVEIQLNELKKINLSLNDQIKELSNYNSILFGEGNRLLNEHNALKETAELMMKEGNSLHKEKEILFIQLRDAENNQSISTQKLKTQIIKLKKDLSEIKSKHDHSDGFETRSEEEYDHLIGPIRKFCDLRLNNNLGKCPYCPRDGFKNVNVHIGHMHKCKNCKKLSFECKCSKKEIIEPIRKYQDSIRYF